LRVPDEHVRVYRQLVPALRARARGGYTWASPDVPEIYFLSGLKNPTRTLYDFFDDPRGRRQRILQTLQAYGVTAVVLNRLPVFSNALASDLVSDLEERYPYAMNIGPYQLRWHE